MIWLVTAFPVGALSAIATAAIVRRLAGGSLTSEPSPASGMTVIGSIAGCAAYSYGVVRFVLRRPVGEVLDAVAFSLPLSVAVGRLACALNGCCYGTPFDAHMPSTGAVFSLRVGLLDPTTDAGSYYASASRSMQIWNLPLLLGLAAVATLALTESLYRARTRLRLPAGSVICSAALCDAALRFPIEFVRQQSESPKGTLSAWQWALVAQLGVAVFAGVYVLRLDRRSRAAAA